MRRSRLSVAHIVSAVIGLALLGALIVVGSVFDVIDPLEAVLVVACIGAIIWTVRRLPYGFDIAWPRPQSTKRSGARDEIPQLAWLLYSKDKRVSYGGMREVRETAFSTLRSVGLELHSPVLRPYFVQLLGEPTFLALTVTDRQLTTTQLVSLINTLENVENLRDSIPSDVINAAFAEANTYQPLSSGDHQ